MKYPEAQNNQKANNDNKKTTGSIIRAFDMF